MDKRDQLFVLIAEDDALVADVIQNQLEQLGHVVVGRAMDGVQAVELANSVEPDVVLMDIQMPEMDGLEATRAIQKMCPKPVVLLTAHETPDLIAKASEAGAGAYLIKPSTVREIQRTILIAIARFADLMRLQRLNQDLQEALDNIKTLRGLLPICASCKKIRDDQGYWTQIETYIHRHSEADFSHSICPECAKKLYPEYTP
jgi:AmiR/NasT family two-component response regulator